MDIPHLPSRNWRHFLRFGRNSAEIHDAWRLEDGTPVRIRAARPGDAALIQRMIVGLSVESRYHRFFYPLHELPPDMLALFTRAEPAGAMNLLAVVRQNGEEVAVGIAQYVVGVAEPYPERAEFAAVVADAWQRRGIATRLLRNLLCIARAAGIESLGGDILSENEAMIGLMLAMGFEIDTHPDGAYLMKARKEVAAPAWNCSPLTELVAQKQAAHAS